MENSKNQDQSSVQVFNFKDSKVRIFDINGLSCWSAKELSNILGYSDTQAMTRRLDDNEMITYTDKSSGQGRNIILITESGLYNAIIGSTKPEAKEFKRWITSVVLPSIRKTGYYSITDKVSIVKNMTRGDVVKLLLESETELEATKATLAINAPLARFAEDCINAEGSVSLSEAAKILKLSYGGIDTIGRNLLIALLRSHHVFIPETVEPYQRYMQYFSLVTREVFGKAYTTTLVTQKGLYWIKCKMDKIRSASASKIESNRIISKGTDDILKLLD